MTGTVTVTKTRDWLTPFEVEVQPDDGQPATAKFMAASKAQEYALAQADQNGLTLVYRPEPDQESLDVSRFPMNKGDRKTSRVTTEEFQARYTRICAKCKQAKPLNTYRGITHRNKTTGREVFHEYAARCGECEAEHGE